MTDPNETHLRFMTRTRAAGLDRSAAEWALAEIERLRADLAKAGLMPIYGATEPDQGEDYLGERRGYRPPDGE